MIPMIELKSEIEGIIKLEVIKEDGTLKEGDGLNVPFKNLITDAGLDALGNSYRLYTGGGGAFRYCRVGTGNTVPTVSDTRLSAQTGNSSNSGETTSSVQYTASPYYSQHQAVYTFAVGAVSGNLTEIGFFSDSSGGTMWSRALIKDSGGNPTTLTLLATEQLKVTYTVIRYIPASQTGTFTLNTNGANSTINYTIKPAHIIYSETPWVRGYCNILTMYVYARETDILGTIEYGPSGGYSTSFSSPLTYINGSFQQDATTTLLTSAGNFTTGIGSVTFWVGGSVAETFTGYQCSFSPKIKKTASQTLAIGIRISWGRTTAQ